MSFQIIDEMKKRFHPAILLFPIVLGLLVINRLPGLADNAKMPLPTLTNQLSSPGTDEAIKLAIFDALHTETRFAEINKLITTDIENISISIDGTLATAWLVPKDIQTGQIIPTEPGLAVIQRRDLQWRAILPGDPDWMLAVQRAPPEILYNDEKQTWLQINAQTTSIASLAPFTGYFLPWRGGVTLAMTQSVAHDHYTTNGSAHYAFDFATPGTPQMFDLLAAKSGTVKQAKDTCDNGSTTCANWLVLEDTSTNPISYQLYLHLAKNSIPAELHTPGRFVRQGEFIGVADDTGLSTGHHLHFMVHTNPFSYWGTSVDITFNEVTINGGRPRITTDLPYCRNDATYHDVCNQVASYYISANHLQGDITPPYGDILDPLNGITLETNSLHLEGWAYDDQSGLSSARFIAKYDDAWHEIGSPFSSILFSMNWDLCSSNVPDGPVDLALAIYDNAGNYAAGLPGLRHFVKNYECPSAPPGCTPNSDQVALFQEPDYQGACQVFSSGNYSSTSGMATIGDDQTSSILVGSNVMASLYFNNNFKGRGETFTNSDTNLVDNLIGSDTTTALSVRTRNTPPGIPTQVWPTENFSFHPNATVTLVGDNSGGGTEFQAKVIRPGGVVDITSWQKYPVWQLGSLSAGTYTWQMKSRNGYTDSGWSAIYTFSVSPLDTAQLGTVAAPLSDNMEGDTSFWIRSPYWDRTLEENHTLNGSISWKYDTNVKSENGYDTGLPSSGDLTTVPIQIPASGNYQMRFWYRYETETPWRIWDQRRLQISVNGNPFEDVYQFSEDQPNTWLQSPAFNLTAYAGQSIQIRFHFETLDKNLNKFKGWYLDDLSITNGTPTGCDATNEPNAAPAQAVYMSYNYITGGLICPSGDIDYYSFQGIAGDHVGITVYAQSTNPGSMLDSYLTLYDSDGVSPLAENDDMITGIRTDSHISYFLSRPGTYFFSIRAWDHPSAGGNDYSYTVGLFNDSLDPSAYFQFPVSRNRIPDSIITLSLFAQDESSGISHVQFYWHPSDWNTENWRLIGEDWDATDGWSISFDASVIGFQPDMAFYARVYDNSGNWRSVASWNLSNSTSTQFFPLVVR